MTNASFTLLVESHRAVALPPGCERRLEMADIKSKGADKDYEKTVLDLVKAINPHFPDDSAKAAGKNVRLGRGKRIFP
jgi:hypothetical protein